MPTEKGRARALTAGEIALARSVYRDSIDYARVEVRRARWFPFQPRHVAMAPTGHLHFHPDSANWSEDFAAEGLGLRGLFVHEMAHVWQWQRGVYLPLMRHPFCRYAYSFVPGRRLAAYGLEQQAEIVRHAYLLREGYPVPGAPPLAQYEGLLAAFG